jgi:hypothetical protein
MHIHLVTFALEGISDTDLRAGAEALCDWDFEPNGEGSKPCGWARVRRTAAPLQSERLAAPTRHARSSAGAAARRVVTATLAGTRER